MTNADIDLIAIADGIKHADSGRLCLYGPAGTGKTAYGRWLAEYLGKPLILEKVSDLQSMYVGETEQNIARAFERAQEAGAMTATLFRRGADGAFAATELFETVVAPLINADQPPRFEF